MITFDSSFKDSLYKLESAPTSGWRCTKKFQMTTTDRGFFVVQPGGIILKTVSPNAACTEELSVSEFDAYLAFANKNTPSNGGNSKTWT